MFRRIAHLLGLSKKDEGLEMRFARIKQHYLEAERSDAPRNADLVGSMRITGSFPKGSVNGSSKETKDRISQELIKSYAIRSGAHSEFSQDDDGRI